MVRNLNDDEAREYFKLSSSCNSHEHAVCHTKTTSVLVLICMLSLFSTSATKDYAELFRIWPWKHLHHTPQFSHAVPRQVKIEVCNLKYSLFAPLISLYTEWTCDIV